MTERLMPLLFILSVALLSFFLGAFVATAGLWPQQQLLSAFKGMFALYETVSHLTDASNPGNTDMWYPARSPERGVTVHDPARAQAGLTLYTSGHDQVALLIDMEGEVVHGWRLPYSAIWEPSDPIRDPVDDAFVFLRKAHLFANGDLLALYIAAGRTPWGYGIVRMDRDSRLIWKYLGSVHHDFDIGADGRVYTLGHRIRTEPVVGAGFLHMPQIADSVVVLSADGVLEAEIDILDAFLASPFRNLLTAIPPSLNGDSLHANGIDVVTAQVAPRFPFARPGEVLLSFRATNSLALLDVAAGEITWALRGPWVAQHDPDLLDDGTILVFDNLGDLGSTRVVAFDPLRQDIVWSYAGSESEPLWSRTRGAQQRLANGNTLITESEGGRILEVTAGGDIVWEYHNPERTGDDDQWVAATCWASRYDRAALSFLAGEE